MKAGWTTRSLGEICQIRLGKTPARAVPSYWDSKRLSGHVWLSIADLQFAEGKLVHDSSEYLSDSGAELCTPVSAGTLLLSFKLTLGRLAFAGRDLFTNEAIAALPIIAGQEISKEYLYWYLAAFDWESASAGEEKIKGVTLNKAKLAELPVHFPKLPEQRRIVALLDEAFAGLATAAANAERNLDNARKLFESHLAEVFSRRGDGWVETTVGHAFDTSTGTTPPKGNAAYYGDFIPFVKPPELCDAPLDSAADNLSEAGSEVARTLPAKSILVSCIGNLGKVGLNTVPVAFNQQLNAILPDASRALPELMFFQCRNRWFKEQLEALAGGTTVPIVNKSKFNSIKIVLPPLREQQNIVAQLDALAAETQRLARIYEQRQAALAALKRSLLHQAFSGNL